MTKVFIGGSRRVSRLAPPVCKRIDRIIEKDLPVIVGDANGADKAVQSYLNNRHYQNVEVFCSGRSARNNLGGWHLRSIGADSPRGTVDFYTVKDRAMTDEATVGLMVWDGKSAGTLLNVFRLLSQQKKVVIYAASKKEFHELKSLAQWDEFITQCPFELRRELERRAAKGEGLNIRPQSRQGALVTGHHP